MQICRESAAKEASAFIVWGNVLKYYFNPLNCSTALQINFLDAQFRANRCKFFEFLCISFQIHKHWATGQNCRHAWPQPTTSTWMLWFRIFKIVNFSGENLVPEQAIQRALWPTQSKDRECEDVNLCYFLQFQSNPLQKSQLLYIYVIFMCIF